MYEQDGDDDAFKPWFSDVFELVQRIKHQQEVLENIECKAEIYQTSDKVNDGCSQIAAVVDDDSRDSDHRNDKTENMHRVDNRTFTVNNVQIHFGLYLLSDRIGHGFWLLIDFDEVFDVARLAKEHENIFFLDLSGVLRHTDNMLRLPDFVFYEFFESAADGN